MRRRVFRIDLENLHELDLRIALLVLKDVQVAERDMRARIVRRELDGFLVGRLGVGELGRLHVGVALGQKVLGRLVMASRHYQNYRAEGHYRAGPGQ